MGGHGPWRLAALWVLMGAGDSLHCTPPGHPLHEIVNDTLRAIPSLATVTQTE
jgi:hypothetical protein